MSSSYAVIAALSPGPCRHESSRTASRRAHTTRTGLRPGSRVRRTAAGRAAPAADYHAKGRLSPLPPPPRWLRMLSRFRGKGSVRRRAFPSPPSRPADAAGGPLFVALRFVYSPRCCGFASAVCSPRRRSLIAARLALIAGQASNFPLAWGRLYLTQHLAYADDRCNILRCCGVVTALSRCYS